MRLYLSEGATAAGVRWEAAVRAPTAGGWWRGAVLFAPDPEASRAVGWSVEGAARRDVEAQIARWVAAAPGREELEQLIDSVESAPSPPGVVLRA